MSDKSKNKTARIIIYAVLLLLAVLEVMIGYKLCNYPNREIIFKINNFTQIMNKVWDVEFIFNPIRITLSFLITIMTIVAFNLNYINKFLNKTFVQEILEIEPRNETLHLVIAIALIVLSKGLLFFNNIFLFWVGWQLISILLSFSSNCKFIRDDLVSRPSRAPLFKENYVNKDYLINRLGDFFILAGLLGLTQYLGIININQMKLASTAALISVKHSNLVIYPLLFMILGVIQRFSLLPLDNGQEINIYKQPLLIIPAVPAWLLLNEIFPLIVGIKILLNILLGIGVLNLLVNILRMIFNTSVNKLAMLFAKAQFSIFLCLLGSVFSCAFPYKFFNPLGLNTYLVTIFIIAELIVILILIFTWCKRFHLIPQKNIFLKINQMTVAGEKWLISQKNISIYYFEAINQILAAIFYIIDQSRKVSSLLLSKSYQLVSKISFLLTRFRKFNLWLNTLLMVWCGILTMVIILFFIKIN